MVMGKRLVRKNDYMKRRTLTWANEEHIKITFDRSTPGKTITTYD
jgi:hypothetical protein